MSWVIKVIGEEYCVGFYTPQGHFSTFNSFDFTIEGKLAAINLCSKLNGGQ
jgi:hypothetical protein